MKYYPTTVSAYPGTEATFPRDVRCKEDYFANQDREPARYPYVIYRGGDTFAANTRDECDLSSSRFTDSLLATPGIIVRYPTHRDYISRHEWNVPLE